ncbi:MAG: hypothetical protein DIZ80_13130 [endosymbiont of Galathealinum brachiosum]|uniref:Transferrin-binding protein B C-lobe/N-lobe beta barrel domain-containing protein n=1 Tax=endosymbiont of Galathealinum brachiosum TaxID=2200906 RepID=A0A370D7Z3_9GAMM|nr:MAG: hypothetical protein DIZ80_13130 [endosymbiont of Galathealinum brachiosum]
MILKLLAINLLFIFLAACGGGGGGTSTTTITDDSPDGIWTGTISDSGATFGLTALVYDNEMYGFSNDGDALIQGSLFVSGTTVSGTAKSYAISTGEFITNSTISGTVQQGISFTGSTSGGSTFNLTYDDFYDRAKSLPDTSGIWSVTNGFYTATITVQNDGSFTGSDTEGCVFSGNLIDPDSTKNIFNSLINVSSCGILNGAYGGLASLGEIVVADDVLVITGTNTNFTFLFGFQRQ